MVGTFSIVAIDKDIGLMGVAVTSGSIAVGTRVPWAKPGVGVVATQAYTNIMYGKEGLRLLEYGKTPREALDELLSLDPKPEIRQVCIMNSRGVFAAHTGVNCPLHHGHILGGTFCVLGNLLISKNALKQTYLAYLENEGESFLEDLAGIRIVENGKKYPIQGIKIVLMNPLITYELIEKLVDKIKEITRKILS